MCCRLLCSADTINLWLIIIFLGMTAKKEAGSTHRILHSKVSKVGWCLRTVVRNVRIIVKYGFNVDRAYWDGLRVGCRSTDESIWNTSCNTNLKPGGCSGIALESSWAVLLDAPHIPAGMWGFHWNPQEWDQNPQESIGMRLDFTGIELESAGMTLFLQEWNILNKIAYIYIYAIFI